jgi:hypothetical protein
MRRKLPRPWLRLRVARLGALLHASPVWHSDRRASARCSENCSITIHLVAAPLLPEAAILGKLGPCLAVGGGHHRIVLGQFPFLAVSLRR